MFRDCTFIPLALLLATSPTQTRLTVIRLLHSFSTLAATARLSQSALDSCSHSRLLQSFSTLVLSNSALGSQSQLSTRITTQRYILTLTINSKSSSTNRRTGMDSCPTSKQLSRTPRSGLSSTRIYPPSQSQLLTPKNNYIQRSTYLLVKSMPEPWTLFSATTVPRRGSCQIQQG